MGCTKEVFLTQVWSKHGPTEYSIYVSDLDGNAKSAGVPRNTCPHCKKPFFKRHLVSIDYASPNGPRYIGEFIVGWNFKHDCGAELLVIND